MPYTTDPDTTFFTVCQLQSNRALLLHSGFSLRFLVPTYFGDNPRYDTCRELNWVLILEEEGEGNTRLVLKTRAKHGPYPYRKLTMSILLVGGEGFTAPNDALRHQQ
jgi:hypothetical protein